MTNQGIQYSSALRDFENARWRAQLEQIVARLTGRSSELLPYEEVRQKLRVRNKKMPVLKEIPLDAIVGSVGRYTDFTRSFLPKEDSIKERWARVKAATSSMTGLPPIEVYQIGDVYFVLDGNHRVSVARQLGSRYIEAYVTEFDTKVPLTPDVEPDELILKEEYADFLARTGLDELRSDIDLSVTLPGQYRVLEEHIEVHRHFMGLEQQREIPYQEAAAHWYDYVYQPVLQLIRELGILRDFPGRTETDLYVWVAKRRAELQDALGWDVEAGPAAADLAAQASSRPGRVMARVGEKVLQAVTPDELEAGPPPGEWRVQRLTARTDERLFADILVPVNGEESGWQALEQALEVAHREGARLHGLHVAPSEDLVEDEAVDAVRAEFENRCDTAGISGRLVVTAGKISREICDRSRWTDLVAIALVYPPPSQPLARLGWGSRNLLRRCPRPILAVPGVTSSMNRVLLTYDGSPKAQEALFVATYLAGKWQVALAVLTVLEGNRTTADTLDQARSYLQGHGVDASYIEEAGAVGESILRTVAAHEIDTILMGGYGHSPVVEVVVGSTVDEVLEAKLCPVLICR
jgi:nucleotide-binding universal stress UspA family protein